MSNWIIVTSINRPNATIKKLSEIKGWNLVVVGDKKTPEDYQLDNCTYLGIKDQEALDFKIMKYLPWNHYCRKNIGYLYAIKEGASLIWETDDDNIPTDSWPNHLSEMTEVGHLLTDKTVANIYLQFGVEDIWPRGFPLQDIAESEKLDCSPPKLTHVPVQQGLADNDPDVDAIFRLTRARLVRFDSCASPVVLPKGTFCPFNSQNTTWYPSAFWGLLLFGTVPSRVTDIWRGYFTQRLLWENGCRMAFLPPAVWQERNKHNYIDDFKEEYDLYVKSKSLIELLLNCKLSSNNIFDKLISLTEKMAEYKLIEWIDLYLTKAWIEDLLACGYSLNIDRTMKG